MHELCIYINLDADVHILGVHSLSFEHGTSTGVLANFSRESANLNRPFFAQISGRNFLPELFGGAHPETASLQSLCCAICSTEQSTFRGGEKGDKVPRNGEEGWPAQGAKRKKGRVKTGQLSDKWPN